MVDVESDISTGFPLLRWPEIKKAMFLYTGEMECLEIDSLMVLFVENRPATSVDADVEGELLIRYDPETGDVIGVEIEGFERFFTGKHHPELADGWAAIKPENDEGIHNSSWLTDPDTLDYACRLRDMAYQGTLAPGWPFEHIESIDTEDRTNKTPPPL